MVLWMRNHLLYAVQTLQHAAHVYMYGPCLHLPDTGTQQKISDSAVHIKPPQLCIKYEAYQVQE